MKIKLEVDVEASEMRELVGLPDVSGLQSDVLKAVGSRVNAAAKSADPLALLKAMVPPGLQSVVDWPGLLQRAMQEGMAEVEIDPSNRKGAEPTGDGSTRD
ncbi:MAG: hypothetical protein AAF184_05155 [Pseudomonadota bacterium]